MNDKQSKLIKAFIGIYKKDIGSRAGIGSGKPHSTTDIIVLFYLALTDSGYVEHAHLRQAMADICSSGALSKSFDRLQELGLIVSESSPSGDGRQKIAKITKDGITQYQALRNAFS